MIDIDKQVDYWRSGAREDWAVAEGIRVVDDAVMVAVRKYLTALRAHGLPVQLGVIFGSQATGTAGTWSDIDLLVVSPHFDGVRNRRDIDLLWHLAARVDNRIEPVPCGAQQWRDDRVSPIVEIARREGVAVVMI
jgi:predicted nucleotidyltransferase